ncbi:hypothetical protein [uncultured Sphingomonas sp.]|uniref:hypothetical protein n=1 Tax=uncultured Sphingomonas sp. TaxID=158754 RepID=UPI0025DEE3C3|nr:hypothetical protein [uncultured Sphingomonas sp.]
MCVFTEASPACLFKPFKSATDKTETFTHFPRFDVSPIRVASRDARLSQDIAVYSGSDLGFRKANRK